jgi:type IV pilus biogenesis protein CpaD/CtpE
MNYKVILMIALTSSLVACSKQETSTSPALIKENERMAQDIAKIREIKEQEQKDKGNQKAKSDQFGKDMKQGTEVPRIEFK